MLTGYKILVAEDNALNQKIANFLLLKQGAEITTVPNGLEAIKQMELQSFDFILMDLQMPEMDGFETTTHIRTVMKSDIPIIALSASNFEDELEKCIETGMNASIRKPFDMKRLEEIIGDLTNENKISPRKAYL